VCGAFALSAVCACERCAVRGLFACAFLGGTRHDADVPLCWMGVSRRVYLRARVRVVMVAASAALVGMRVGPAEL
jgi:hypothetical protein